MTTQLSIPKGTFFSASDLRVCRRASLLLPCAMLPTAQNSEEHSDVHKNSDSAGEDANIEGDESLFVVGSFQESSAPL